VLARLARLTAVGGLLAAAGCAPAPTSPAQLAYCLQLYQLHVRYHTLVTFSQDGQHALIDLALQDCTWGDYPAGIKVLTALLTRIRVNVPPAPPQ
jgi:hypothetical protein